MNEDSVIADAVRDGRKIVVGGFVQREDGRLLLVQRSAHEFMANSWEIPSGGVEVGESFVEALEREFLEETGARVVRVGPFVNHFDYGKSRQLNYLIELESPVRITLSDEHQDSGWFLPSEIDLDGPMRRLVLDFFDTIGNRAAND